MSVPHRRPIHASVALCVLVALAVVLGSCGGSDGGSDASEPDASPAADGGSGSAEGASSEDAALGFRVTADPGTELEVDMVATIDGDEQPELSYTITVADEPDVRLFSRFVDSAELSIEVTEGGPATVEAVRGVADPEDPFAGVEVAETLDQVEVAPGSTATLTVG